MPVPKNDELAMLRAAQRGGFSMRNAVKEAGRSANTAADIILRQLAPREPEVVGFDSKGRPLYKSLVPFSPPVTDDILAFQEGLIGGGFGGAGAGAAGGMRFGRKPMRGQLGLPESAPVQPDMPLAQYRPPGAIAAKPQPGQLAARPQPGALAGSPAPTPMPDGSALGMPSQSGALARQTAQPLPPGNNPFARPGAVVEPAMRPGLPAPQGPYPAEVLPPGANPFARQGRVVDPTSRTGLPAPQGGALGMPRATGMTGPQGAPTASPMPGTPSADPWAGFGQQFTNINYGPNMPRGARIAGGLGAAGLATGLAALAGGSSDAPPPVAGPVGPDFMDYMNTAAALPDALANIKPAMQGEVPAVDPTIPEPIRTSGRNKRRGMPVTPADEQRRQQNAAQIQMQQGVQPTPMPVQQRGGAAPNYWVDLMQAADSGDAYARDFVVLREQAREAAQQAAMQGRREQYVPLMDYRNNAVHIVNAGGNDVVLDLNDPQDRAQYASIAAREGDPTMFQRWMQRSSAPLMGYFRPPGSGTTAPQFSPNETIRLPSMVR